MKTITTPRQIGAAVRDKRQQLGMTQQQLADAADVSRGFIARLEKGTATAIYLQKLLDVLAAVGLHITLEGAADSAQAPSIDASRAYAAHKPNRNALFDEIRTTDSSAPEKSAAEKSPVNPKSTSVRGTTAAAQAFEQIVEESGFFPRVMEELSKLDKQRRTA